DHRPVRPPPPVRPAPPDPSGTPDLPADYAGPAGASRPAADRGPGLPPVRPPLPNRHGPGQTGPASPTRAALPRPAPDAPEAILAHAGKGPDVLGRFPSAGHLQRGGARQPPVSE